MNGTDHLSDEERYALEAADAALAGDAGVSNHAELGVLSRLLVSTMPQADPAFERALEELLVGQRRANRQQTEDFLDSVSPVSTHKHPPNGVRRPVPRPWTLPNWVGRGLRQTLDAAVTLALLAIFFAAFLWPSLRPARRETAFYYHMPDGLTHDDLYGEEDSPLPVEVNGRQLWRSLTLAEVQTLVDFSVLAPTVLDDVRFQGAYYVHSTGAVFANYAHPAANQTLMLMQQPVEQGIEDADKLPIGPEARVETIRLNGVKAEYVEGTWDTDLESSYYLYINRFENPLSLDWDTILRMHWTSEQSARILRWEKDGILYTLKVFDISLTDPPRSKPGALYLDREGIIQLAENLQ